MHTAAIKQELIDPVEDGNSKGVSKTALCELSGVSIRTLQRWQTGGVAEMRKGALEMCLQETFRRRVATGS